MPEPHIEFPADFKPAPIDQQLHEIKTELFYFERAAAAGKVNPNLVSLRRWSLKSAIFTLQQLQQTVQPVPPAHDITDPEHDIT